MPIGSSKIGVLGAGLVPGGTETFNASGTFSVPPGVKIVSIEGKGATGNPGNPGNAGNPGNLGTGASGGGGGGTAPAGGPGGGVRYGFCGNMSVSIIPGGLGGGANAAGQPGSSGVSGSAGSAGSAGNPGNTGQCSSGLGNNFAGGAGGNAGAAGNAGNAGSGGQGGVGGTAPPGGGIGGAGGNGGGSGSSGHISPGPLIPGNARAFGGGGGGGAGATNDGASSPICVRRPAYPFTPANEWVGGWGGRGGGTANYSVPGAPNTNQPNNARLYCILPSPGIGNFPSNQTGSNGATPPRSCGNNVVAGVPTTNSIGNTTSGGGDLTLRWESNQPGVNIFSYPLADPASQAMRSGGGGGRGATLVSRNVVGAGGGGGGGRGNAGNPGGAGGGGGTGTTANPTTFNCVPVTPGCSYPITVASPGGQVVISWNPQ